MDAGEGGLDVRWMRAVECAGDRNEDVRKRKGVKKEEEEEGKGKGGTTR